MTCAAWLLSTYAFMGAVEPASAFDAPDRNAIHEVVFHAILKD